MKASKYLIAGGTTNWVEPLAKFYADDERKRREHGERLKARDAEQLQVLKEESLITGVLPKLEKFSKSISTLVDYQKQAEKKKAAAKLKETDILLTKYLDTAKKEDLLLNTIPKWNQDIKKINAEHIKLKRDLNELEQYKNFPQELKDLIINSDTAQLVRMQRVLGNRLLNRIPTDYRAMVTGLKGKDQVDYDRRIRNNPLQVRDDLEKYAYGQLREKLGFNDEFIVANGYYDSIQKIGNTKGVLAKLDYEKVSLTTNEILLKERLANIQPLLKGNPNAAAETIQTMILEGVDKSKGITHADSADNIAVLLYRLSKEGGLPTDVIDAARQGLIQHPSGNIIKKEWTTDQGVDEPAKEVKYGKGDLLFSDENWALIQSGEDEFINATITNHDNTWARRGAEMRAKYLNGDIDINTLNSFKSAAIRNGQENKDWFKDLDDLGHLTQNPDTLKTLYDKWNTLRYQGFPDIDKATIEAIPDQTLSDEMLGYFQVQKAAEKKIGYESGLYDSTISDTISVVPWAQKATFASGDAQNIAIDVERVRQAKVSELIAQNIRDNNGVFVPNSTIKQEADDFAKDYWVRNGGGVAIQNGGTGKFSHSISGDPKKAGTFPNWRPYNKYIKNKGYDHSEDITPANAVTYYQKFEKRVRDGGFLNVDGTINVEKMRNTAGAVFTIPQMVATFKELKYSEEMLFIAERLQTPVHVLFEDALTAIKNVPTPEKGVNLYDQFGQLLGIDNKTNKKGIPLPKHVQADKTLLGILEKASPNLKGFEGASARSLIKHLKIYGWGGLSNNNKLIIYKTLLNNVDENSLKELQELANNPLQSDYGLVPVLN